jgi:large subunit ribosomal protein L4
MEAKIYNQEGKEAGNITLPEQVFGLPWNSDLVHQVVSSMLSSARKPVAHTKTRGEVSGGGKKPWQQKGTGRARHGSIRSPIWVGGGVAHGPRNDKNFDRKINKKMKTKALFTILSKKVKDGEVLFVESLTLTSAKSKDAKILLSALGGIKGYEMLANKRKNAALITLAKKDHSFERGFNNFGNIEVDEVRNINPVDVLKYKYLVIDSPAQSVEIVAARAGAKKTGGAMKDMKDKSQVAKSAIAPEEKVTRVKKAPTKKAVTKGSVTKEAVK